MRATSQQRVVTSFITFLTSLLNVKIVASQLAWGEGYKDNQNMGQANKPKANFIIFLM